MPLRAGDPRPHARVIGDPARVVLLPVGRGFGKRTLLAKTCLGCGALKDASDFPLSGTARTPDPRCDACHAARWPTVGPKSSVRQAESLETATRYGQEWTGPELAVAMRRDLTHAQAARLLGRTWIAVRNIRRKSGWLRLDGDQTVS